MKTYLPDDIARLTNDAEFEFTAYREFEKVPRLRPATALAIDGAKAASESLDIGSKQILALSTATRETKLKGRATDSVPRQSSLAVIKREPASPTPSAYPIPAESRKGGEHTFRALDALTQQAGSPRGNIRKTTVVLFASSGGCGVTTIAATLGRLLSGQNEPVVLVDGDPQSLLGAYFGIRTFHSGIRSIVHGGGGSGANVHVVSHSNPAGADWLAEVTNQLDGEFERMIVDESPHFSASDLKRVLRGAVALVPLLPDMRTVCRVEPLIERLTELSGEGGVNLPIYFILTQFDANVRLHCEIRAWLRQAYGPMLLPFTLRRGDEASEALADGATVMDYAPNCGLADDFHALADWVQQLPHLEARS